MRRLFDSKLKKAVALILALLTVSGCLAVVSFASGSVEPIDILNEYCVYTEYRTSDGYIGIPVGICVYTKETAANSSATDTQIIFYVMNYNDKGENLSNEADIPIIYDLVDEGNVVITLDYFDNEKACTPALTHSVQKIRTDDTNTTGIEKMLPGYSYNLKIKRVMMSGYRMASDVLFYDLTGNAPKGVKESTVSAWNSSGFKTLYTNTAKKNSALPAYETKTSYDQLYKPDLTPLDSRMWLDIFYPSRPVSEDVPVLCWASSSQTRSNNHSDNGERPHDVESMARGYAFAIYDHCYYPMARNDHYGYFNPYGIQSQVGIHTHAAAIRCVRYFSYLYGYGTENYGGFGHSKSALIGSLANPHPEDLPEQSPFDSKYKYYRNEEYGDQPYLAYKDSTEEIPSNLQFCYSSMGLGVELHARNHTVSTAPMFTASGISDEFKQWEFWAEQLNTFNNSNSPYIGLSFLNKGHEYVYGTNAVYGFDELTLAFDYIDYNLKDNIAPKAFFNSTDALDEVTENDGPMVQFTGVISEESIKSGVTITDNTTGATVPFKAVAKGGGTSWSFYADNGYINGHEYTLDIGSGVRGANGVTISEPCSIDFVCDSTPEIIACSAELFSNSISYYSTVAFQFSAPMSEETLKKYCTVTGVKKSWTKESGVETIEEFEITPVFEMVGDEKLWTIASSANPTNKWSDSTETTENKVTTAYTKYEYTITIGAEACATNGVALGEDYVVTFKTK